METRKHRFSTRVGTSLGDPDAPSPAALVMKPPNVSNLWMDGKRDGHQGAIGGAWPDPDAATRCLGATWEMAYFPTTCTTCRLHVRLHAMEIERRRFAAVEGRVRAGCHPHDGLSRRHGADARGWLAVTHPRGREKALKPLGWLHHLAERIIGARLEVLRRGVHAEWRGAGPPGKHCPASGERPSPAASMPGTLVRRGHVSPWRTPMRRVEPDRSRSRPTGSSGAVKASSQPTHCHTMGLARGWLPPPLRTPRCSRSRGGRGWGRRPLSRASVRRDA